MNRIATKLALAVAALLFASTVNAALVQYSNRAAFEAQGTVVENYGFDDFGTDFSYPGDPWTAHGVTYQSGNNIVVGTGTFYAPISNVLAYDYWTPLDAAIAQSPSRFDMFGLDLGYLGFGSDITFTIVTNLFTYVFPGITAPIASQGLDFYGFVAGAGEYFTGFNLAAAGGSGSAPVIDNVTLGLSGQTPVPEPSTVLLMGAGLLGLAFAGRSRNRRND